MEMSGERIIAASRADVWAALNDPEVLKVCIPGCQSMERAGENGFTATVVQKVGPVKATFLGEVELTDIVEGESYRISGKGKGGAAGAASGGALVRLTDVDGGTNLTYEAEAKVTGKIAQLGSRLIDGFAKKMADQFFTTFQDQFASPEDGDETAGNATGDDDEAPDALETAKQVLVRADEASKDIATGLGSAIDSTASSVSEAARDIKETIAKSEPAKKGFWSRLFGR